MESASKEVGCSCWLMGNGWMDAAGRFGWDGKLQWELAGVGCLPGSEGH